MVRILWIINERSYIRNDVFHIFLVFMSSWCILWGELSSCFFEHANRRQINVYLYHTPMTLSGCLQRLAFAF